MTVFLHPAFVIREHEWRTHTTQLRHYDNDAIEIWNTNARELPNKLAIRDQKTIPTICYNFWDEVQEHPSLSLSFKIANTFTTFLHENTSGWM